MKKIISYLFVFVMVFSLVGCGSKKDDNVLHFWTPFTGPDGAYMQNIVDSFNEGSEEIKVEMQVIPGDQYYEKLRTAYRSGNGPQVAAIHADQIPSLVQADVLANLNDFTDNNSLNQEDFILEAWNAGIYKKNRYSIPLDVHPLVMYVNKDIVEEYDLKIPENFSELINNGKKVTDQSDLYGFALPTIWPTNLVFRSALLQNGMEVISEDGTESNLDSPVALEVAQLIESTWKTHGIAPSNLERDGHIDLFKQGKVAFTIDGIWMSDGMNEAGVNYTVAPLQNLFGSTSAVWANSHQLVKMNDVKDSQSEIAESFITYLSENSIEWAKGGQVPANLSVMNSEEFKKLEVPYIASTQMESVKLAPQFDAWIDVWSPLEANLSEAYLGSSTLEESLQKAAKEGNEKAIETLEQIKE